MASITVTPLRDKHGERITWSNPLADHYQEAGTWLEWAEPGSLRHIGPVVRYDDRAFLVWLKDIWSCREVGPFRAEQCRTVPFNAPVIQLGRFFAEEGPGRVRPIPTLEELKAFTGLHPTPRSEPAATPGVGRPLP